MSSSTTTSRPSAPGAVSAAGNRFLLPASFVAALASAAALSVLNGPLRNAAAPMGVVSLETARTLSGEHTVMASWGAHEVVILAFSTGLAFFCSATFTVAFALGCARLAAMARAAFPKMSLAGAALASALSIVGVLWIAEDGLLALELFGHATAATAFLAWCFSLLKFAALGAGTAYFAGMGAALGLRRRPAPAG